MSAAHRAPELARAAGIAALAVILARGAAPAAAEPRRLTLAEAVELAAETSLPVAIGREQVVAAEAQVRRTRTLRLPTLGVRANLFVWNEALELDLGGLPLPPGTDTTIRDQVTATVEVTVAQPITAAIVLGTLIALEQAAADAARAEVDGQRIALAYQAAELYLSALQARTLRTIAETSVAQVEANLGRARALREAGILSDVDLLRLEAQREQLRQQALEAEVGAEQARRGLALLLRLPAGVDLELVEIDPTPPPLGDEAAALEAARRHRPDLRAAAARARQADLGIDVARARYLPSVHAVATYTRNEGQGTFAAVNTAFVGITLDWNLWDWGNRRAQVDQARSASRQAQLARDHADEQIAFDVRTAWLAADVARRTLDVAESGLRAAEEASRLQTVRFAEGAATTTDVIDAEAEVARARAQATIARYQYLLRWMALARATGEVPDPDGARGRARSAYDPAARSAPGDASGR